eukprot:scaffold98424_cov36-Prasinocladus_malaysianus.AAC.1
MGEDDDSVSSTCSDQRPARPESRQGRRLLAAVRLPGTRTGMGYGSDYVGGCKLVASLVATSRCTRTRTYRSDYHRYGTLTSLCTRTRILL